MCSVLLGQGDVLRHHLTCTLDDKHNVRLDAAITITLDDKITTVKPELLKGVTVQQNRNIKVEHTTVYDEVCLNRRFHLDACWWLHLHISLFFLLCLI